MVIPTYTPCDSVIIKLKSPEKDKDMELYNKYVKIKDHMINLNIIGTINKITEKVKGKIRYSIIVHYISHPIYNSTTFYYDTYEERDEALDNLMKQIEEAYK